MLPLLPFVAGIATGALAIKLWRGQNARTGLGQAQEKLQAATGTAKEKLRKATVSSLAAIEQSSAKLRTRLIGSATTETPKPTKPAFARKPAAVKKVAAKPAKTLRAAKAPRKAKSSGEGVAS